MYFPQIAQIGFIALACVGVYGFVNTAQDGESRRACAPLCALRPSYSAMNRVAPDFELPALGGGKLRLSQFRGKSVILNFWTKSCAPCLEEMPSIANLAKVLKHHPNVVLLTISTDETLEDVKTTLNSVLGGDAPFPVLLDSESAVVLGKFGTKLYPETWFIDPKGVIRARFDGERDWASPLVVDLAESLGGLKACEAVFVRGHASAESARYCGDLDFAAQ